MKKTIILELIIINLLIAIYISASVLNIETRKKLSNLDYTIYTFEPKKTRYLEYNEDNELTIRKIIDFFQDIKKERKYKYYRKFELNNYCTCDECRINWKWDNPPVGILLIPEFTVAANPKVLKIGTYIRINGKDFLVYFTDEKIPENQIYVYMKKHDRSKNNLYSGIWDVYKEK